MKKPKVSGKKILNGDYLTFALYDVTDNYLCDIIGTHEHSIAQVINICEWSLLKRNEVYKITICKNNDVKFYDKNGDVFLMLVTQ